MRQYSFIQEFSGNCAAGVTGVESLATRARTITSTPVNSLLKSKAKRAKVNGAVKKHRARVKSLVR